MNKCIIILLGIMITIMFIVSIIFDFCYTNETILLLTAFVILWYTNETYKIRKISQEQSEKSKRPIVGFDLYINPDDNKDVRFKLINYAEYPVSCLIKLEVKVLDIDVKDIWPDYNGERYWNLQVNQIKEGHFNWLQFLSKSDLYNDNEIEKMKKLQSSQYRDKITEELTNRLALKNPPSIEFKLEVFSFNEFGYHNYYPNYFYYLKIHRLALIPGITSNKPFLNYDLFPKWVGSELKLKLSNHCVEITA